MRITRAERIALDFPSYYERVTRAQRRAQTHGERIRPVEKAHLVYGLPC
jgi:hypothetical protein